jgi:hypothetical protein
MVFNWCYTIRCIYNARVMLLLLQELYTRTSLQFESLQRTPSAPHCLHRVGKSHYLTPLEGGCLAPNMDIVAVANNGPYKGPYKCYCYNGVGGG